MLVASKPAEAATAADLPPVRADFSNVLIVIPCLDEVDNLPRLLTRFSDDAAGVTIVVVDGGSSDASRAIVADFASWHPKIKLIDNPKRIQSAGINLAVRQFGDEFEWLLRVDAHCAYPPDYVSMLITAARTRQAASVVVPMRTVGQGCFQKAAAAAQNSVLGTGGAAHRHAGEGQFVDHGHHALMAMAAFRAVGGYDENFSHNEDAELDHRLGRSGARIWLEPAAELGYMPRGSAGSLFRQYRAYGSGRARTVSKHRARLKPRQMLPLLIAPMLIIAVAGVLASLFVPALLLLALPAALWLSICIAYGIVLGVRTKSLCAAGAGIAAMIMHLAWSLGYWQAKLFSPNVARNGPV